MTIFRIKTLNQAMISRTLPFALFMAFIAVDEGSRLAAGLGLFSIAPATLYYLYPLKTAAVALLLLRFKGDYRELRWRDLANPGLSAAAAVVGLITCVIWLRADWTLPAAGGSAGFNPALLPAGAVRVAMTFIRVAGAVLVVPVMEELFWRSFLARYLIDANFESVAIGRFTWATFLITVILFGLEHHLFWAGVAAGVIYNLILYKSRSLAHCVLAHSVTNLALACFVLSTASWQYW